MRGSIDRYSTKSGVRWRFRVELLPDPSTGERRQLARRGFRTKREAEQTMREALAAVDQGAELGRGRQTVAEYLTEHWLPSIKPRNVTAGRRHRGTVSAATLDAYRGDIERYVIPRIGRVRLDALTPRHLDRLYDDLEQAGGRGGRPLAVKTVANVAGVLHKALADAVKQGLLLRNPADAVSPPTPGKPDTKWWSVDELRTFLRHVQSHELYAAWLLFATTGARRGEVAALTWDDLDLEKGLMRIDWTLGHVGHELTWKPRPKSRAGNRTLALDPATVTAIKAHRRYQAKQRLAAGPVWNETFTDWQGLSRTGILWTYGDGSPIHPKSMFERFLRLSKQAGLPRIRLHDVRHTYASAALASATGWHQVKVISQRLGHANVGITLDTYSHVLPAADEEIAHTLAEVILGDG